MDMSYNYKRLKQLNYLAAQKKINRQNKKRRESTKS